jgi:branched-chain amino acid aminotransferase
MAALTVELGRRNDVCQDVYFRPIFFVGDETLSPTLPETPAVFAIWCMPLDDYLAGDGVTAMVTSWQRVGDNMIPPRAKPIAAYLNSALARADAKDAGCDEAVFLTNLGYVAEGSAEHVFIVRNGRLITPPTEDNNLDGITRRTLLEVVPKHLGHQVEVRHVGRTELYIADEMFFVGTGAQVTPVLSVDRRPLGDGRPGPITRRVRELYGRVVRNQVPEYGAWCTPVYG